jgi:prevent-host-death family protein
VHANLSVLIDDVSEGREVIITKGGQPVAALINVQKLHYFHRLESAATQIMWLDEAAKGLAQIAEGQTSDARQSLAVLQKRRKSDWKAFEQQCELIWQEDQLRRSQ